ncbi:MAG TPA: RNA pseudouridine synthase [Opitutaceae bacterium]
MSPVTDGFWGGIPLGPGVRLIASDPNGLGALDKPDGVLSHPNSARDEKRSLVAAAYDPASESYAWAGGKLWLVNRLDSATSGLILVASREDVALAARAAFKGRQVKKAYKALVFGKPGQPSESWRDVLSIDKSGGRVRARAGGGNIPAECRMTLERTWQAPARVSLLSLQPLTGRSHQLRVQCAKRGLPIVGDQTYGNFAANRAFAKSGGTKRMHLHSHSIAIGYALGGARHEFSAESPVPAAFGPRA